MSKNTRVQIFLSIIIAGLLFSAGFFAGKKNGSDIGSSFVLNATSTVPADFGPFWEAWEILDKRFTPASSTAEAVSSQEKVWGAIAGLAASYGDPYTVFFPPVESKAFEEEISGSFGGVGMEVDTVDGVLTVVAPLKGTPAERAGIEAGDRIIAIDGESSSGISTTEAVKLIRGEVGTKVSLTIVKKSDGQTTVKDIVRSLIDIPTVNTELLPNGVFVIELYNFSAASPDLFRSALREFVVSGSNRLVLDLRNNPGGFLEAALDMASWFLPAGKVVVTEDFGNGDQDIVYRSRGYDIFNDKLKMAILVNQGSASASEILAGALREYNKAVIVGESTFGKGSVQELVPVTSDTSLKITVAHWLTPLGNSISEGGITPDIEVEVNADNTADGADPVLDAAVKYLLSQ